MKQLFSILLALIILSGNMGFSIATHYCGDMVMESQLMLGQHDLDCGMAEMEKACSTEYEELSLKKRNCCEDHYLSIDIEDDFFQSIEKITFDTEFVFITIPSSSQLFELSFENEQEKEYCNHSPPPILTQDFQVLYQTFLL